MNTATCLTHSPARKVFLALLVGFLLLGSSVSTVDAQNANPRASERASEVAKGKANSNSALRTDGYQGVPGPIMGVSLPLLIIAGGYFWWRMRKRQA